MRFQLERFAFWVVLILARVFPRKLILSIGSCFGLLAFVLDRRHRFIALQNFSTAFPDAPGVEAREVIRKCYAFFGRYLFEVLSCLHGISSRRIEGFEYEGLDHLEKAYAQKKGVIIFTGHWGVWELMGIAQGYKGYPLSVVARELDNPYLQHLLNRFRTMSGNQVIEKRDGYRPMLRSLNAGKALAILIDQNVTTNERIFVDFFGKSASTTPAIGLLKLKTDASLIPGFALPLPGDRYRFIYGSPVQVALSGDRSEDVRRITQECTRILEEQIRKYPAYWLWMHRRWKTRPEESSTGAKTQSMEEVLKA